MAQNIGAFAGAALADPEQFHSHQIDLAAESFTLPEIPIRMTKATGNLVSGITLSEKESLAKSNGAMTFQHELWNNVESYKLAFNAVRSREVPLTTLDQFIRQHRDKFVIG